MMNRRIVATSMLSGMLLLVGCQTTPLTTAEYTNRTTLSNLRPSTQAPKLTVEKSASIYRVGDPIRFRVTSAQAGKLWVVQVDPHDRVNVLYPPAQGQVDHRISANTPTDLPNPQWTTSIQAAEPAGMSELAFIVTPINQDLSEILTIQNGRLIRTAFASDQKWSMTRVKLDVRR